MGKRRLLGPALKAEMRKLRALDYRSASRDEIEYIEEVAKRRRVEWKIRIGGVWVRVWQIVPATTGQRLQTPVPIDEF